ncbi:MAG TPA: alpha/beta hydrolase [Burkholderiales bacterium]|nr:alpha/beta hydrolase [Burkholderiales bacterium]
MLRFVPALLCAVALAAHADDTLEPLGLGLEGFPYPHEVRYLPLEMEGERVAMAYMDVAPTGKPNGRTALLLHGRNFFGAYWKDTIDFLSSAGWRVVVPDQIGFGKSSKPDQPLSFHGLARENKRLLDSLGVEKVDLIAHSMGGMLAVRFALMYPGAVDRLVLEDPIGLEDYRLMVPYASREQLAAESRAQTRASIDRFFRAYFTRWDDRFQIYADVAWRWMLGPEAERLHRVAANTYTMAYEQPVLYELPQIRQRTLIVVGSRDRTALGRNRVSPQVRETMGHMPELARAAASAMPHCNVVVIDDVGHIPHLEATDRFHAVLFSFLALSEGATLDSRAFPAGGDSTAVRAESGGMRSAALQGGGDTSRSVADGR